MSDDPTYEQLGRDWIGRLPDGRRTMLKGSLAAARADVAAGRLVCARYPYCPHRDADDCMRRTRRSAR